MKTPKRYIRSLFIILTWAIVFNIVMELLLIFILMSTPLDHFSRVGVLSIYFQTWERRNYRNTISVIPDDLVGYWVVESSSSVEFGNLSQLTMTTLILHTDQTFELLYPVNNHDDPPNVPKKHADLNASQTQMIHLSGVWGICVSAERHGSFGANTTWIIGKYKGENEYVSLGQVLATHDHSYPHKRFVIKWSRAMEVNHPGPDNGIYLKKSSTALDMSFQYHL